MKKILIILFLGFFMCGCQSNNNSNESGSLQNNETGAGAGSKIVCIKNSVEDGYQVKENIEFTYTKNKLNKIVSNVTNEMDTSYIDTMLEYSKSAINALNKLDGITYDVSKKNATELIYKVVVDYEKVNIRQMEEAFEQYLGDDEDIFELYERTNNLEAEIRSEMTEDGYTCK